MTNIIIINSEIRKEIDDNVISYVFPKLNRNDKNILLNGICHVIDYIGICFNFIDNKDKLLDQLRQNKYKDTISLLLITLPFINDDSGIKKKEIVNLNDIYITKQTKYPINEKTTSVKYVYSNIQYGRIERDTLKEIQFDISYYEQNLYLLLKTIERVSHKLFVNWMDVLPITYDDTIKEEDIEKEKILNDKILTDFRLTKIYQKTKNNIIESKLKIIEPYDIYNININDIGGLHIGEIYDIIVNDFFETIKNIKWMIYDVQTSHIICPVIVLLNTILDLNKMISLDNTYEMLDDNNQEYFFNLWKKIINIINTNTDDAVNKISYDNYKTICVALMFFFDKYYDNMDDAIKDGYITLKLKLQEYNDNIDEEDIDEKTRIRMLNNMDQFITSKIFGHLYNYIYDCLNKFKLTFYGKKIIKDNNIIKPSDDINLNQQTDENDIYYVFTYKNLYNYAKSLCHYNKNGIHTQYPIRWESLNNQEKEIIMKRLNAEVDSNFMEWFNISGYIKKIYSYIAQQSTGGLYNFEKHFPKAFLVAYHNRIYIDIRKSITELIFSSMAYKGILSCLKPTPEITNDNIKTDKHYYLKNNVFNKNGSYFNNAYYFLTGEKYCDMNGFHQIIKGKKFDHWFDYNGDSFGRLWFDAYALNWVSQINFFHRYLNNRIIYATGSTGVGKSTQIPKLLLYALKSIDYKNNGSIICSQPRQAPTANNASIISLEMGVPIEEDTIINNKLKKTPTNNYNIQFKHKVKSHELKKSMLTLKIVTDGLLIKEAMKPLLKRQFKDGSIRLDNEYDIVIVDEAHEHNHNMDLILTYMKDAVYYNNDIKLVIVSATMDDDEPIYRRYYRDINDNKMYPLNYDLVGNKIDRINVDRRLHISPPGQTTRYKIDDNYIIDTDTITQTIKVANDTTTGDILLFEPGRGEITKVLDELNSKIPPNMIAIPFFSDMDDKVREFVEQIDANKSKIKLSKTESFNNINVITTGNNSYNRVLIVATNIAEASITIDGLRYVIETGSQKTNIYDYRLNSSILKLTNISESSRLQRRGRVGRTGPGSVYYMYKKGAMEETIQQYKINNINIYLELFDMLINKNPKEPLFNHSNDPNMVKLNYNKINKIQNNGLKQIILKQYFSGDTFYDYYGNDTHYDYKNKKSLPLNYQSKYTYDTLLDNKGEFYIIHPNENAFIRNILGQIIKITDDDIHSDGIEKDKSNKHSENGISFTEKYTIKSEKMETFFNTMRIFNLIDNKNRRTEYGELLRELSVKLDWFTENFNNLITYIHSIKYNCEDDIIKLLALLKSINGEINALSFNTIINNKPIFQTESLLNMFGKDSKGDIYTMLNIINFIHQQIDNNFKLNMEMLETTALNNYYKHIMGEIKDEDIDKLIKTKKIRTTKNKNNINLRQQLIKSNYLINLVDKQIIKNNEKITDICQKISINPVTIQKYFMNYISIKKNILLLNLENEFNMQILLNGVKIKPIYKDNSIMACLLHGYPFNVVKKMGNSKFYISTLNPYLENVYSITPISRNYLKPQIICNDTFLSDYVFYLNLKLDTNTISIVSYVSEDEVKNIYNIFGCSYCNNVLPRIMMNKININTTLDSQYYVLYLYTHTLEELKKLCNGQKLICNSTYTENITNIPFNLLEDL
jgi:hypothetical protein